jgi:rod shape determining protein RodA
VLYREGLNKWLCIPFLMLAALFIGSMVLTPMTMLVLLIVACTVGEVLMNGEWQSRLIYLAVLALVSVVVYLASNYLFGWSLSAYNALLGTTALSLIAVAVYAYRAHLHNIFIVLALFVGSMIFLPTTSFLFNSVLKEHQQNRIYSFLGIINDPQGIDFNVNQSKIAIGSGGMFGKGFLEGTQVKYNFVPENHTDFIFCTVGEEWGFLGCLVVLAMYGTLILRLMRIGERQEEPFGRIYCYCVASILLFHLMVNVGMTIGLMPVMGIPLPFMSYGGSSLLAFTLLLFIAIRFDAARRRFGVE